MVGVAVRRILVGSCSVLVGTCLETSLLAARTQWKSPIGNHSSCVYTTVINSCCCHSSHNVHDTGKATPDAARWSQLEDVL